MLCNRSGCDCYNCNKNHLLSSLDYYIDRVSIYIFNPCKYASKGVDCFKIGCMYSSYNKTPKFFKKHIDILNIKLKTLIAKSQLKYYKAAGFVKDYIF